MHICVAFLSRLVSCAGHRMTTLLGHLISHPLVHINPLVGSTSCAAHDRCVLYLYICQFVFFQYSFTQWI